MVHRVSGGAQEEVSIFSLTSDFILATVSHITRSSTCHCTDHLLNKARRLHVARQVETELATLTYLCENTLIPVPSIRGYRVSNWETDYILMDFVEGQKLCMIWTSLSQAKQISYVQQIASYYAELDHTSFTSIGSLRLGGVPGPLDSLDTIIGPNGRPIGMSLGPYENLQAFYRGHLYQAIEQLETDELLKANAYLCQDLYCWADDWSQKVPESDSYCLSSLECLKMEDMIVRDGKIVAVVDLENYQTNVPEFLKLYPPLQLNEEMNERFTTECVHLGIRAWAETDEASKK
jgi:hypothetical protein